MTSDDSRPTGRKIGIREAIALFFMLIAIGLCIRQEIITKVQVGPSIEMQTTTSGFDGMEMVFVPAGEFAMGSDEGDVDEQPVHEVYLDAYWIDKYEVTNAQYAGCVKAGACEKPDNFKYFDDEKYVDHPVISADWFQAQSYCEWVGRRLPTEAEWEKAARGIDGRMYPWGEETPTIELVNFVDHNQGWTTSVGTYPDGASPYGALDMAGNVWEWVADTYDVGYYGDSPLRNPTGPSTGHYRVIRGGSWGYEKNLLRTTQRCAAPADTKIYLFGFRCAISP